VGNVVPDLIALRPAISFGFEPSATPTRFGNSSLAFYLHAGRLSTLSSFFLELSLTRLMPAFLSLRLHDQSIDAT
jgi:hypothetical protein